MLLASITDGTAGDQAVNRDSRIQPLLTFRHFLPSSRFAHVLSRLHSITFSLSHISVFSLSMSLSLSFSRSRTFSRALLTLSWSPSIFRTIFPFLSFSFFHQINIIIMNPRYEYVAPLFLSAASNVFLFFFYLSKCNRDLYKNVHLLRLIVTIFII